MHELAPLAKLVEPCFGMLADRWGHHRIMQLGPVFGAIAVTLTFFTVGLFLAGLLAIAYVVVLATRILEGASSAASVPSILGYIAKASVGDELLRGRASARFEGATIAGLGAGLVPAGPLYEGIHATLGTLRLAVPGFGPSAFLVNAVVYGISYLIYRFGVIDPLADAVSPPGQRGGFGGVWFSGHGRECSGHCQAGAGCSLRLSRWRDYRQSGPGS